MSAVIRPAAPSDLAAIVAIENAVFDADRISRRSLRAMIGSASAAMLVAVDGDVVRGYCAVLFRSGNSKARLYSIAAAPGARGVGRLMLEAAETAALGRGAGELRLEVRADNARAISLYEQAGYRQFERIAGYYEDGATALRYRKAFPSAAGLHAGVAGTAAR